MCFITKVYCQLERNTTQIGISGLPVFDVLKFFPDNKISGVAVTGNLGYLGLKNTSVGIQPYYAKVSNIYTRLSKKEKQEIKLYGLNTYVRYYFIRKEKFLTYTSASLGFGNSEDRTIDLSSLIPIKNSQSNTSVFVAMLGAGLNYFIIKNLALELNVSYINIKYIATPPYNVRFQTVAPTIGLQFYWL